MSACPECGTPTEPRVTSDGHRHVSYCLPCTEETVGETYVEIRDRATASAAKSRTRKWEVSGSRNRVKR